MCVDVEVEGVEGRRVGVGGEAGGEGFFGGGWNGRDAVGFWVGVVGIASDVDDGGCHGEDGRSDDCDASVVNAVNGARMKDRMVWCATMDGPVSDFST